jgi:hypothetical protein
MIGIGEIMNPETQTPDEPARKQPTPAWKYRSVEREQIRVEQERKREVIVQATTACNDVMITINAEQSELRRIVNSTNRAECIAAFEILNTQRQQITQCRRELEVLSYASETMTIDEIIEQVARIMG